jgi:hypothetical protein
MKECDRFCDHRIAVTVDVTRKMCQIVMYCVVRHRIPEEAMTVVTKKMLQRENTPYEDYDSSDKDIKDDRKRMMEIKR